MHTHRRPIEVLPQPVVEKIAAGEVIERPASVLKELIENSIDAGATAINAAIDDAGFSLISISDNGCGMSADDLGKSLLAHATSKLRNADDLFAVTTMGFRGEALASIAAVSRMRVVSSDNADGLGYEVTAEGGVQGGIQPVSHVQGTTIEVRDLFYNVPARKKFMKTGRGEQLAVVRMVEQVAVPFPAIHFTLTVDGRRLIDFPRVAAPLDRIAAVTDAEFARGLIACEQERPGINVQVFVTSPFAVNPAARARHQGIYVNLRRVENDSVIYSIREAFSQFLSSQFRPSFFCFLAIDPARVDVNVHPTKQQVKFDDERGIAGLIFSAVKRGLAAQQTKPADFAVSPADAGGGANHAEALPDALPEKLVFPGEREKMLPQTPVFGASGNQSVSERFDTDAPGGGQTIIPFPTAAETYIPSHGAEEESPESLAREQMDANTAWDLISCYQIHEMYILAPIKNGIVLIDQHAAHERILYEQALEDCARGRSASQQLLFPVVIELSTLEKNVVTSGAAYFSAFGFELGDFGGNAVSASAIPFFMKSGEVEHTVRAMVRYLLDEKERDAIRETEKRFAAAFACGAAIKAGQKLSQEEMNALVNNLFAAKNPYICPHGRPTLIRISLDELSRRFLR